MKSKKSLSWGPGGFHKLARKKANVWLTVLTVLFVVAAMVVTFVVADSPSPRTAFTTTLAGDLSVNLQNRGIKEGKLSYLLDLIFGSGQDKGSAGSAIPADNSGAAGSSAATAAVGAGLDIPQNDPAIFAKHDSGPGAPVLAGNFRGPVGTVSLAVVGDPLSPLLSFQSLPGRDYDRLDQFIKTIPPKTSAIIGTTNPNNQAGIDTSSEFYKPEYANNPPLLPSFKYFMDYGDGSPINDSGGTTGGIGPDHDLFYNYDTQKYEKAAVHKYSAPGNYIIKVKGCYQSGPPYLSSTFPFKLTKNPNRGARGQSDELPNPAAGPLDGRCSPEAKYLVRVVSRDMVGDAYDTKTTTDATIWRFGLVGPDLLAQSETNILSTPDSLHWNGFEYVDKDKEFNVPHSVSGVVGMKLTNLSNHPVTVSSVSWGAGRSSPFVRWQTDNVKLKRNGSVIADVNLPIIHTAERETTSPCFAADNANRRKGGDFTFTPFTIQPGGSEELSMDAHFIGWTNCSGQTDHDRGNYLFYITNVGQNTYSQPQIGDSPYGPYQPSGQGFIVVQ